MASIEMCDGTNCPVKDKCYRFTAPKSYKYQDFMIEVPFRKEKGKTVCDLFVRDKRKNVKK
jgi:hypothetical protein